MDEDEGRPARHRVAGLHDLDVQIGNDGRLGFRVPSLVISPLARRGFIAQNQYDHTSILSMIEWRWGLPPLTVRDAAANNLAEALDFTREPDLTAPRWEVPQVVSLPCPTGEYVDYEDWKQLAALARAQGWRVG